jgi:hypothetical protein
MIRDIYKTYNKPYLDKAYEPCSRPKEYPTPDVEDLLFFIQRNYNTDAVLYQIKYTRDGLIDFNEPMEVSWMKFNLDEKILPLNYMQRKLAYGYDCSVVNKDLIEFEFVSHPKTFFIAKIDGDFKVVTEINGDRAVLKLAYIYADENGVFPDVKFIELYGHHIDTKAEVYERLNIQ